MKKSKLLSIGPEPVIKTAPRILLCYYVRRELQVRQHFVQVCGGQLGNFPVSINGRKCSMRLKSRRDLGGEICARRKIKKYEKLTKKLHF